MTATRAALAVASILVIIAFAGGIVLTESTTPASDAWIGLFSVLLPLGTIAAVVLSFLYARSQQRSPVGWAVGALFFPYAVPLVLAALSTPGAVVSRPAEASPLKLVLVGKWICACGEVRDQAHEGEICPTCGKPRMRFVSGERNQRCSSCGFLLSDAEVRTSDRIIDVWSRKGFRCSRCGSTLCLSCVPKDVAGEPTLRCSCGGGLGIRL